MQVVLKSFPTRNEVNGGIKIYVIRETRLDGSWGRGREDNFNRGTSAGKTLLVLDYQRMALSPTQFHFITITPHL